MAKVDGATANILVAVSLIIGTPFFLLFGWLSDRIGRKPIIMAGLIIAALTYFPLFKALTHYANPVLETAQQKSPIKVSADPADCSFQFNPTGTVKFTSSCDIAKQKLAANSVSYTNEATPGQSAVIKIGENTIKVVPSAEDIAAAREAADKALEALKAASPVDEAAVKAAEKIGRAHV